MSRRPRIRRGTTLAATAAVILAIAVAVIVHRSGDGAPSANASAGSERTAQLWHDVAQCLRTHGHPTFHDPTIDSNGDPDFGAQNLAVKQAVATLGQTVCRRQFAALPAAEHHRPPTQAELHAMVLFARCMRAHGLSDWPDPHADGTFPLSMRIQNLGKAGMATQLKTCRPLLGKLRGFSISASSLPPGAQGKAADGK
jgi:hypothetical protein